MIDRSRLTDFTKELALLNPSRKSFPLHETRFSKEAAENVSKAILDGNVSALGPELASFEAGISEIVGSTYTVGVASGTAALHISLHALDIGRGDEVIVPTLTFIATVNAVLYTGASPVFIDSGESDLGMDPTKLQEFLQRNCVNVDGSTYNKNSGKNQQPNSKSEPYRDWSIVSYLKNNIIRIDSPSLGILIDKSSSELIQYYKSGILPTTFITPTKYRNINIKNLLNKLKSLKISETV
jgi:hypothetical protein